MDHHPYEELERLLVLATLGELPVEKSDRLNEILRNDPGARKFATRMLQDEAALVDSLSTDAMADLFRAANLPDNVNDPDIRNSEAEPSQRNRSLRRIAAPVAGVIAATLLLAAGVAMWHFSNKPNQLQTSSEVNNTTTPPVIGTLVSAENCRWLAELNSGDRLTTGFRYSLREGTARILLTSGTELYCSAPAEFQFVSSEHAIVSRGTLIADVGEAAIGFRLETPTTNVIDLGTLFAVKVNEDGHTDVEVLEGAVSCLPVSGPTPQDSPVLEPGEANRFVTGRDESGTAVTSSQPTLAEIVKVARETTSEDLIAYESFESGQQQAQETTDTNGWKGGWHLRRNKTQEADMVIREGGNLVTPNWLRPPSTSFFVAPNNSMFSRALNTPINTSEDGVYFVSVVMRKKIVTPDIDRSSGAGFRLEQEDDRSAGVGISIDFRENLTVWTGDKRYLGPRSLPYDTSLLIAMKIRCRKTEPDIVSARAFDVNSLPEVLEPKDWDVVGKPASLDGKLEWFRIWSDASAVTMFDEIRIARTWSDAVPLR